MLVAAEDFQAAAVAVAAAADLPFAGRASGLPGAAVASQVLDSAVVVSAAAVAATFAGHFRVDFEAAVSVLA